MTLRRAAPVVAVAALLVLVTSLVASAASTGGASGRQSRTSSVAIGGADVFLHSEHSHSRVGGTCSLSFAVRRRNAADAVLTAGHCARVLGGGSPYDVFRTTSRGNGQTDPGVRLGEVTAGHINLGKHGDSALVTLAAGVAARPAIYTGNVTSSSTKAVSGITSPHVGLTKLCYSGARTGEHCGFSLPDEPRTMTFDEHGRDYRIRHEWAALGSCAAKPGDSGAPVFVKRGHSVRAVGILSGGGTVDGHCAMFFTPVKTALRALHVRLLTG